MLHTPVDESGSPIEGMMLAGAPFQNTVAPNLTPHEATGLGLWGEEEIAAFLATGLYDDGMEPHAAMKQVADAAASRLTGGSVGDRRLPEEPAAGREPVCGPAPVDSR